ncbi:MAG: glycine--tRNA ligase subunit beta [Pseudomonadota bacterium]|nr:glycine--tRNA ligase subunit beta [Pseudomonadota bacterium]
MSTAKTKSTKTKKGAARPRNLLLELGTEELPPKALQRLGRAFADGIAKGLQEAGLLAGETEYRWYATPRRLAVWAKGVLPRQLDRVEERRGPALKAAFDDDGNPTRAALGFAGSCGVGVEKLERLETAKGAWLVYRRKVRGEKLARILDRCMEETVKRLPIPKRMRWGASEVEFVRPVHWLVALHGADVVDAGVLGLRADRYSRGHRFHAPGRLRVSSADRYASILEEKGRVIADYDARQGKIRQQVERLAKRTGGEAVMEQALLDEVTGLVEWPVALLGEFEKTFLQVPPEALVSSMSAHQKYFHMVNGRGRLLPAFITVSNIQSKSPKRVREGNERVLRARLADARFFWETDRRQSLARRADALQEVLFHVSLGSVYDKALRIEQLAGSIAKKMGVDEALSRRAALLAKADLVTEMVGEFPDLQGVMGRYYAATDGEPAEVAEAIDQHYAPRQAGGELPRGRAAQAVALADKLDTLLGIFASGEIPTGDKDPYALRRAALGVLRILIEKKLDLDLEQLLSDGVEAYAVTPYIAVMPDAGTAEAVFDFMQERLRAWYQGEGYSAEEVASVLACRPSRPLDFHCRLLAVSRFLKRHAGAAGSLAAANKRIANILGKAKEPVPARHDPALLTEAAERRLAAALEETGGLADTLFDADDYTQGLTELAKLREPVDRFFDDVMVMCEDPALRDNRLALLGEMRRLFLQAADISHLRVEK